MTSVVVEGLAVFLKMECRGPKPEKPHAPLPNGPGARNTAPDTVVVRADFGAVKNYDGGASPHPCARLMGTTP